MRPTRRALATTTAAAVLLSTGACGGANPEPAPLPKPTASLTPTPTTPTTTSTPTSTPPVMPAAAKAKTKAGAIAAVRHFLAAMAYAGESGKTRPLRETYVKLCTRCEAIADGIDETYSSGGTYRGGSWTERSIMFYKIQTDVAILDVVVDYTAQTWIRRRGATATYFKASPNHLHAFQLKWVASEGWRVGALDPQI